MSSEIVEWNDRAQEIRVLHNQILTAYRKSVEDAIRIGEILSIQRQDMGGKYTAWIGAELPFSEDSAERYVLLFEYQDKIRNLRNLQEAYQKVKKLQDEKRKEDQERKNKLIAHYEETGQKAEGWDRSVDYELKKRQEAGEQDEEKEQRIDKEFAKELQRKKVEKELFGDIEKYIDLFEDSLDGIDRLLDYLQTRRAQLKMKKAERVLSVSMREFKNDRPMPRVLLSGRGFPCSSMATTAGDFRRVPWHAAQVP